MSNDAEKVKELTKAIAAAVESLDDYQINSHTSHRLVGITTDLAKAIEPPFQPKKGQVCWLYGKYTGEGEGEYAKFARMHENGCLFITSKGSYWNSCRPLNATELEGEAEK